MAMNKLGKRLKTLIDESGRSIKDISKESKVPVKTIEGYITKGDRMKNAHAEEVVRLAYALDVTPIDLLGIRGSVQVNKENRIIAKRIDERNRSVSYYSDDD